MEVDAQPRDEVRDLLRGLELLVPELGGRKRQYVEAFVIERFVQLNQLAICGGDIASGG
jgi:hypothetical protein